MEKSRGFPNTLYKTLQSFTDSSSSCSKLRTKLKGRKMFETRCVGYKFSSRNTNNHVLAHFLCFPLFFFFQLFYNLILPSLCCVLNNFLIFFLFQNLLVSIFPCFENTLLHAHISSPPSLNPSILDDTHPLSMLLECYRIPSSIYGARS